MVRLTKDARAMKQIMEKVDGDLFAKLPEEKRHDTSCVIFGLLLLATSQALEAHHEQ